jgi:ClpP class serine protease
VKRRIRYSPPKGLVAVAPRAWGEEFDVFFGTRKPEALFTEEGSYAVVEICGPLSQRSGWFGDSYEEIGARVAAALESGARAVCLRIDSPGGDWCGALELSRELRAMAKSAGKKLVAFTDGMALSAGYAIACSAEEIVATESATVGSIGVWAAQIDLTAQDAMMGVKVAIASSGTAKADRNPHAGITDESFTRLQAQVDEQAELFFELVSVCRGLPVSKIRAVQGAELFGQRAIAAGLSSRLVNSWAAFLSTEVADMPSKASKYDEAYGLLKQAAEGDDEEAAKKAKKCLKAMDEDGDEKKDEKEAKAKAEGDEKDKEKAKAEAEEKDKAKAAKAEGDEKKDDGKAKASAASSSEFDLAKRVHALEAQNAAKDERAERDALLAKRPDFSPEIVKTLAKASLEQLKEAVETWPKIGSKLGQAAAAAQAGGTRGKGQTGRGSSARADDDDEPEGGRPLSTLSEADYIARKMGEAGEFDGIQFRGKSLVLGPMTPAQARAFLESKDGAAAAKAAEKGMR